MSFFTCQKTGFLTGMMQLKSCSYHGRTAGCKVKEANPCVGLQYFPEESCPDVAIRLVFESMKAKIRRNSRGFQPCFSGVPFK